MDPKEPAGQDAAVERRPDLALHESRERHALRALPRQEKLEVIAKDLVECGRLAVQATIPVRAGRAAVAR
jgi:hypothetical protein